jgi:hypothetical protein
VSWPMRNNRTMCWLNNCPNAKSNYKTSATRLCHAQSPMRQHCSMPRLKWRNFEPSRYNKID